VLKTFLATFVMTTAWYTSVLLTRLKTFDMPEAGNNSASSWRARHSVNSGQRDND
jgi:hypothetical protein